MQNNQDQSQRKFQSFIDIMLEVFAKQKIEPLILNGFDDWSLLLEIKVDDLLEFKYSQAEATEIINCIRSIQENNPQDINFPREEVQGREVVREGNQEKEQEEKELPLAEIPIFPQNPITPALLIKGTTMKPNTKTSSNNFLSTLTMINLQEKKITQISHLTDLKSLQILHLSQNCITKIQGLEQCSNLKTLKLDYNYITKIQGLDHLQNLNKLYLNHNMIRAIEGMNSLYSLVELNVSDQQIPSGLKFKQAQTIGIGQSVETLYCNNNKINKISAFKNFKVLAHLEMKNNLITEVSAIADILPHMSRIKTVQFLGNPVVKAQKYRDYLVILSKSLEQIDNKKILPTQRQYLVKLYSLKHAKQQSDGKPPSLPSNTKLQKGNKPQINVNKLQGQVGVAHKLNTPTDFHNNAAYTMSKKVVSHPRV